MRHFINIVEALNPTAMDYRPRIRVYDIEWELDLTGDEHPDEIAEIYAERGLPTETIIEADQEYIEIIIEYGEDDLGEPIENHLNSHYGQPVLRFRYEVLGLGITEALEPRVAKEYKLRVLVSNLRWDADDYEDDDGEWVSPTLPHATNFVLNMEVDDIHMAHEADIEHEINEYLSNKYSYMIDHYDYRLVPAHEPVPPEYGERIDEALSPNIPDFKPTVNVRVTQVYWECDFNDDGEILPDEFDLTVTLPLTFQGVDEDDHLTEAVSDAIYEKFKVGFEGFKYRLRD